MTGEEAKKCIDLIAETFNLNVMCYRETKPNDSYWIGTEEPPINPIYEYRVHFEQKDWTRCWIQNIHKHFGPGIYLDHGSILEVEMSALVLTDALEELAKRLSGMTLWINNHERCSRIRDVDAYNISTADVRDVLTTLPEFDTYEELKLKLSVIEK